jgi:hypothetical protein
VDTSGTCTQKCQADSTLILLVLEDSYGDGWDSAYYNVYSSTGKAKRVRIWLRFSVITLILTLILTLTPILTGTHLENLSQTQTLTLTLILTGAQLYGGSLPTGKIAQYEICLPLDGCSVVMMESKG